MTVPPSLGSFRLEALPKPPFEMSWLPEGWLSGIESCVLYASAKAAKGPILEIGSWVGRSTCVLASGVRDNPSLPILDVFDHGIASIREFQKFFKQDPRYHSASEKFLKVILTPGGVGALLKKNLIERDLESFVNSIILAEFKNVPVSRKYSFCFCDVSHDDKEIKENVPAIVDMLDKDDFLIVFDDVATPETCRRIQEMCKADKAVCLGGGFPNGEKGYGCKISIMAKGDYYCNLPWLS